jgi:hypothetical protein
VSLPSGGSGMLSLSIFIIYDNLFIIHSQKVLAIFLMCGIFDDEHIQTLDMKELLFELLQSIKRDYVAFKSHKKRIVEYDWSSATVITHASGNMSSEWRILSLRGVISKKGFVYWELKKGFVYWELHDLIQTQSKTNLGQGKIIKSLIHHKTPKGQLYIKWINNNYAGIIKSPPIWHKLLIGS